MIIKIFLVFIIFYISLMNYTTMSAYDVFNNECSAIVKIIYCIITIIIPLIFVLKYV